MVAHRQYPPKELETRGLLAICHIFYLFQATLVFEKVMHLLQEKLFIEQVSPEINLRAKKRATTFASRT